MNDHTEMPTVEDITKNMQFFGVTDYVVFVTMLISCCCVGLFHALRKKSIGEDEYLVGGRNMSTFPVSLSLIASYISCISLLGIPTEIYVYGTSFMFDTLNYLIVGIINSALFLPVFHEMQLTSIYEYLERRFDKKIRILGSTLFSLGIMIWLPIVIYMPALAFNQVTGINIYIVTPFICVVCIFYTCVGGLKAVVWTDFIQAFIMFGTMILICIKGTINLGGFSVLVDRNLESGRLEIPSLSFNPLIRNTIWSYILANVFHNLHISSTNQSMAQRYLALPSVSTARKALWLFILGTAILNTFCAYSGLLIHAWYYDCDPLTTKLAKRKDQLLPLLVTEVLGNIPGLPGLFVSAFFSAALSSLSTGLNSMTAVIFEDFIKPFRKKPFSAVNAERIMKIIVIILGIICTGLVFVVEKASTNILQLTITMASITSGPSLALFFMGVLIPKINAKGALIGGLFGLSFMTWFCTSVQMAINKGLITSESKPMSTDGCTYTYEKILLPPVSAKTESDLDSEPWAIFRISYLLYTVMGLVITIVTSLVVAIFTSSDLDKIDPISLAPFVRKYLKFKKNKFYNIQGEERQYIDALLNKEIKMKTINST